MLGTPKLPREKKRPHHRSGLWRSSTHRVWFTAPFFLVTGRLSARSVAGKAALERADVEPALKALKERLMTKNVAEEIAEKLCDSVATSIVGRKQASFSLVSSTVKVCHLSGDRFILKAL